MPFVNRLASLAVMLLALAPSTHASQALAPLAARLEQAPAVHARFVQTKTLQALKRPLRTSGRLAFARGQGVLWLIEKPYLASYALSADSVTQISADGTRKVRAAREVPALAQVGKIFQAIFQGDPKALEAHFVVSVSGTTENWRVDLVPKPALTRFLKGITAKGGRFLDSIEVDEAQGDHTRIEFLDTQLDAPLSQEEAQRFQP
jgi:outer membrane lipoprotein-sorting protein